MARLPYAARTLMQEVQEKRKRSKIGFEGEPDGLGVYRTLRFDKTTSAWLLPLLEVMKDPRIEEFHLTDAGYLHVTFSPRSHIADNDASFDLDAAAVVAGG